MMMLAVVVTNLQSVYSGHYFHPQTPPPLLLRGHQEEPLFVINNSSPISPTD